MKFDKRRLNLEDGLTKEWIITNGVGGYASQTMMGANTRRYHGLLVASFTPPGRRYVILSKLDESIEIKNEKFNLFTNICKNYISDGYKCLESFEKEYIPIFVYKVKDTIIKKMICMDYGKNTVGILYKIHNGKSKAKLTLAPVVNFRDFHILNSGCDYTVNQSINQNKVKLTINENTVYPIYMNLSEGKYIEHENDIFRDMYYLEEEKRGFFPEENLVVPGRYEIEIDVNEEKDISYVCSMENDIEEVNVKNFIDNEVNRLNEIVYDTQLLPIKKKEDKEDVENQLIKDYILATDNFIVYRLSFELHTIIAGYPWFLDWGRDALIAFEGLLLITTRYELAKEILLTFTRDIKCGLVPNGYSGFDSRPLYNSVDSSLLLFEQVNKYLRYTDDYKFIEKEIYKKLVEIVEAYIKGIELDDNNIYMDEDYLISSGTPNTQNTWMDAKYGQYVVTPRNGKAVEINSLWYNALKILADLSTAYNKKSNAKKYVDIAKKVKKSFNEKFYNESKKCLYDVLGDVKVRPNQLFALSLSNPVIDPTSDMATDILNTVTKKLLNSYGLKTLAKGEKGYIEKYEGDTFKRDSSYHQGITWPWLLGLYSDALLNRIAFEKVKSKKKVFQDEYKEFSEKVKTTFAKEIYLSGMIGSISELYDSKTPFKPNGAPAQAWSVSEIFRIIIKNRSLK